MDGAKPRPYIHITIKIKRMKQLIRNNYLELSLVKAILLGIGYHDKELTVFMGPLVLEIKLWMFGRPRRAKSSTYDVEI